MPATSLPPGPRTIGWIQGMRYMRNPIGFFVELQRRYGDIFSVNFPLFGRIVYVASPDLVKQVFTGKPAQMHAGEANATVLEPTVGLSSVLTLDEGEHMRHRSLLLRAEHDDGAPMSDRELRDELVTVVGAGHETTATALAWALERLLRTPPAMARLKQSIAAGEDDYLDATIEEALRARPVIV